MFSFSEFIRPFDTNLNLAISFAVLFTSSSLFALMRLQRRLECAVSEDRFSTWEETFWFCLKSLLNQGWELLPLTFPARLMAVVWWIFCLVVASSFTANLAGYLAQLHHVPNDIKQLLGQTRVQYGCINSTSDCDFFRLSDDPLYRNAWYTMTKLWYGKTIFKDCHEAMKQVEERGNIALFSDVSYFRWYDFATGAKKTCS